MPEGNSSGCISGSENAHIIGAVAGDLPVGSLCDDRAKILREQRDRSGSERTIYKSCTSSNAFHSITCNGGQCGPQGAACCANNISACATNVMSTTMPGGVGGNGLPSITCQTGAVESLADGADGS